MRAHLQTFFYDKTGAFKFAIFTSPLFIAGLVLKLYASALFASPIFGAAFVPFLKYYALMGSDPYTYFFNAGIFEAFPYPQLMLFIMGLPGLLFTPLLNSEIFTTAPGDLLLYHLPILAADIVILLVLARWLPSHHRGLLVLYWLSPLLIYINYLHSQLDVIPIAFVFLFLHYLFKERFFIAVLLLACGIAVKFHLVILVPFTIIYLWRKHGLRSPTVPILLATLATVFIAVNNYQLLSTPFLEMVFNNREQGKVFDLQIIFNHSYTLFIVPAAYALLLLHSLTFRRWGRDTFVMFLGFAFGILTLCIPPMQGWYYWVIPFFIYFALKNELGSKLPLYLLTVAYFVHFALTPDSDFFTIFAYSFPALAALPNAYTVLTSLNINASLVSNLAFTFLQACLLINVLGIYKRGVEESKKTKLYSMPYLIGIAGDSGSGKTTLTKLLCDVFGQSDVAVVEGDALHRWERGNEMWKTYTHLDPKANKLHEDLEHILNLRQGKDTYRRHYDHHTGTFTSAERLESKKLVIFEGLHSFYLTAMEHALDLKVFIMPEEQLRVHWKILRDMKDRGYSKEKVLEQLQKRERDSAEYVTSQGDYADITFTLCSEQSLALTLGTDVPLELFLEVRFDNGLNCDSLLSALADTPLSIEHRFEKRMQVVRVRGDITETAIEQLSFALTPEIYTLVPHDPTWTSGYNGVMQLFICYYILESLKQKNRYEERT